MDMQSTLFNYNNQDFKSQNNSDSFKFPSTGYQGSKLKLVDWIINETKNLFI